MGFPNAIHLSNPAMFPDVRISFFSGVMLISLDMPFHEVKLSARTGLRRPVPVRRAAPIEHDVR
jgi:hypothetical protein